MPAEFDAGFRYVTKNTELVVLNDETSSSAKKKKRITPNGSRGRVHGTQYKLKTFSWL